VPLLLHRAPPFNPEATNKITTKVSNMNNFGTNQSKEVNLMVKGADPAAIHTTLSIEDLIQIVEMEIRERVQYDSFEYSGARADTQIIYGKVQQHKCRYRINIAGKLFGRVAISRKTAFTGNEVKLIESALGALIIHLNNAAEYQSNLGEAEISQLMLDKAFVNANQ
jgi:hypothetical protein